ncbi:Fe2+ or Zn2+ uptake regulation protein [Mycolicibacterium sp. 624]
MVSDASALRNHLLRLLRHGGPITTSELRQRSHESGFDTAHIESVYRNLLVLQRRGLVTRVDVRGRHAYWATTEIS